MASQEVARRHRPSTLGLQFRDRNPSVAGADLDRIAGDGDGAWL
jgi:hypothetical protein